MWCFKNRLAIWMLGELTKFRSIGWTKRYFSGNTSAEIVPWSYEEGQALASCSTMVSRVF